MSPLSPVNEVAQINTRLAALFQQGLQVRMGLIALAARASEEGWTDERYNEARRGPVAKLETTRLEVGTLTARLEALSSK